LKKSPFSDIASTFRAYILHACWATMMLIPEPASCYYHKIFRIQMELSPSTLYNARGLPCLEWMLSLMLLLRGSIYVIIITLALPFSCLVKWGGRLENGFV
jgi:hypothetical protein